MSEDHKIIPINIEEEMKSAYIDYSMSVIVSRAIPDVRDGLKPVHRRVLYGMSDLGLSPSKPYKKSARIVGEVLGKYHPHGDSSVYDTMVRMAQHWSLRYPLVQGQGNFGSVDGDSPAAMRYTEARLQKITEELLADIDKETVDLQLNFDDTIKEPTVLPTKVPNLLVNGSNGIAVGMATNILPHNLTEVCQGVQAYIQNPDITVEELMQFVKAPDMPTGGTIYGMEGVKQAFETGRGRVVVRGKATIETSSSGKEQIIVTEIPYQVNKANLIVKIAELVNDKKIEGISDVNDESDRDGMRIVVDLKRDAVGQVVLNQLYKFTPLQSSYGVNNIALVKGRPQLLNLRDMIKYFVEFRHEVLIKKTKYDLRKAEERAHILEGYLIALDNLDEVISLIRKSANPDVAKEGLISKFEMSEIQAKAILEMRLQRLTGMEIDKINAEYDEIQKKIAYYNRILNEGDLRMQILDEESKEIEETYGDDRRSDIEYSSDEINIEDLIAEEDMVITISRLGYIKRTAIGEYRVQNRGGKGAKASSTRDEDFIEQIFIANTHDYLLFFTELGRCFWLKVYQIPEGARNTKGRPIQNVLSIPQTDKIKAYIKVRDLSDPEFLNNNFIMFCTYKGIVKKTALEAFSRPRTMGIQAINFKEGDALLEVKLTDGNSNILLGTKRGYANKFKESDVRSMGRTAAGVTGIRLQDEEDAVVGMVVINPEEHPDAKILSISSSGFGKRTLLSEYRETKRGSKGVRTIKLDKETGSLVSVKGVEDEENVMIITRKGLTVRIKVEDTNIQSRSTRGTRLIRLKNVDVIADVAKAPKEEEEEELIEGEEPTNEDGTTSAEDTNTENTNTEE